MADENVDETTVADEESKNDDVEAATEEVTKDEETSNVEETEPDFENLNKALNEIKVLVEKYNQNESDRAAALDGMKETVGGFEKKMEERFEELLNKHIELANELKSFKTGLGEVEKRLDGVESETAVKKSKESAGEQQEFTKSKSVWSNALLPKNLTDLD